MRGYTEDWHAGRFDTEIKTESLEVTQNETGIPDLFTQISVNES